MSDVDWMNPGVCLKNHFHNVYAPLCGIFCPNSVVTKILGEYFQQNMEVACGGRRPDAGRPERTAGGFVDWWLVWGEGGADFFLSVEGRIVIGNKNKKS